MRKMTQILDVPFDALTMAEAVEKKRQKKYLKNSIREKKVRADQEWDFL